jgi:hypothetical protein
MSKYEAAQAPALEIKSVGSPPERYADRIVALMLQQVAKLQAQRCQMITELISSSKGGTPKAQQKLAARLEKAGAFNVSLTPGKRGRFELCFLELLGWDAGQDELILPEHPGPWPEKPWLICHVNQLEGRGTGAKVHPLVFVTHHCLSRAAQRLDVRTVADLRVMTELIILAASKLVMKQGIQRALDEVPPDGHRVQVEVELAVGRYAVTVVLERHRTRPALVALTVF